MFYFAKALPKKTTHTNTHKHTHTHIQIHSNIHIDTPKNLFDFIFISIIKVLCVRLFVRMISVYVCVCERVEYVEFSHNCAAKIEMHLIWNWFYACLRCANCLSFTWAQEINYDSPRGGVSVITEKGEVTTSYLLIQKARISDSGLYTCLPSHANPNTVNVHVLNGTYIYIPSIFIYNHFNSHTHTEKTNTYTQKTVTRIVPALTTPTIITK